MEEDRIRGLMRVVEAIIREKYGRHDQVEEVLAAAYAGMWQSLLAHEKNPVCRIEQAARNGAVWAAAEWMRSRENNRRVVSRRGHAIPPVYSLEELEDRQELEEEEEAALPDHAQETVERLDSHELVRLAHEAGVLDAGEWEIIERTIMQGERTREVAAALGISYDWLLRRRRRALSKLKAALGSQGEE